MAKRVTTKVRRDTRRVRDLPVTSARAVKGGKGATLMLACATGQHIKEATITV
jgi:hypothetical protein